MNQEGREFCKLVDKEVEESYDILDGGDLCYHLLESGEIEIADGVKHAARLVAQRIDQA